MVIAILLSGIAHADEWSEDGTGVCWKMEVETPAGDTVEPFRKLQGTTTGIRGYGNSRGVNINDFNGDGNLDIFVAQAVSREEGGPTWSGDDMLFINRGLLLFQEEGNAWGVDDSCEDRAPMFGDLDNDGYPDLFVTVNGRSVYYHNDAWTHYDDVSATSGDVSTPAWGHQGFLFDYDRDGWLDVFWTNGPEDGSDDNILLHNQRDGTFRDTTEESGVAGVPSGKGTCVLDVDIDGWMDIFVTTGREFGNQLHMNRGDGTFRDEAVERGVGDPLLRFGVSVSCADYDNDGDPDILLVTHDRTWSGNMLYRNDDGVFTDVAGPAGLMNEIDGHGSVFIDVNMDGWLDVIFASIAVPPYLYLNNHDGTFNRVCNGGGITQEDGLPWAVTGADLDGNGYPEIYIANGLGRRPRDDELFKANPPLLEDRNRFVTIKVTGRSHNPSQLGAKVEVTANRQTQTRWVGLWSSFDSQGPLPLTFGVGDANYVDRIRVTFTNGLVVDLQDVKVGDGGEAGTVTREVEVVEPLEREDADHDGKPDEWDDCPGTRRGERTDGQGCGVGQRAGVGLAQVSPVEDEVLADPGTFAWSTEATRVVLQISYDAHFGPAGRMDYGPFTASSVTLSEEEWAELIAVSDGSTAMLWRLAGVGEDGAEMVTEPRRFHIAVPISVVHIPLGVSAFEPAHIVVEAGTTITWWNDAVASGNLQNEPHDVQLIDGHGASVTHMELLNGAGYFTWKSDVPGVWSYLCHRHSGPGLPTDAVLETHMFHRESGPYRCMAGTVTVR